MTIRGAGMMGEQSGAMRGSVGMSDPKPCPFCGSKDVGGAGGQVHCYSCPAIIEVQNTNTNYAVELWNRRADSAELTAAKDEAERLRGRVSELEAAGAKAAMHWSDAQSGYQSDELSEFREVIEGTKGAWLLRIAAEAVEYLAADLIDSWPNATGKHAWMLGRAQRLRTQADSLEKDG